MPHKQHLERHLHDATFYALECERALLRAQKQSPTPGVEKTLDGLTRAPRQLRSVLGRLREHVRQRPGA
jgi:hypothetical protein